MTNKELNKRAKALSNILKKSERDIITRLLAANTFTPTEKAAILTAIENRLKRTAKHTDKWVVQNVPAAYRMGSKDTASALKVNAIFNQDDFVIIQSMIASSQVNIREFVSGMYRSSGRMLNDVTKERLRAKMLEGRITAGTMKKLKAELALELSKGLPGMVDRAGRKWTVENYSDMYARTDLMDKYNQGVVNQAIHNNQDLMYITSIGDSDVCEFCEPWEGEVVSISGKDPNYPSLDDAYGEGVFHPRCRHRTRPYFE